MLLAAIGDAGFALAGAGAMRAHRLTSRPTYDVDLFAASTMNEADFGAAVVIAEQALVDAGYRVTRMRAAPLFVRLVVEAPDGESLEVDLGVDWRHEPPVHLEVGPVLSLRDAVGSKVAAAFSRGEVRDLLDIDSIRQSGRFSDTDLLLLAREHDEGFSSTVLAENLERFTTMGPERTAQYEISADLHREITERLSAWARTLR